MIAINRTYRERQDYFLQMLKKNGPIIKKYTTKNNLAIEKINITD